MFIKATHCRECGEEISPDMLCPLPMYCPGFSGTTFNIPKGGALRANTQNMEHDISNRNKGGYEVWAEGKFKSISWQTMPGAQACLDRLKQDCSTPLEIFYVHRIPTADEKEAFHVTKTGRDPSKEPLLRSQMLSEGHTRRVREGLDSDTGTGSQTVARLREELARSTKENSQLQEHIESLEEELNKERK